MSRLLRKILYILIAMALAVVSAASSSEARLAPLQPLHSLSDITSYDGFMCRASSITGNISYAYDALGRTAMSPDGQPTVSCTYYHNGLLNSVSVEDPVHGLLISVSYTTLPGGGRTSHTPRGLRPLTTMMGRGE